MITIVVPVFNNIKMTDEFFSTVSENTVLPTEVILINNGSTDKYHTLVKKYNQLNINHKKKETNEGVNSAWNDGIRLCKTPYLSILNDDIILNKYFFQKIIETMKDPKVGIVIPLTVKRKKIIENSLDVPIVLKEVRKREGWAFTIRKSVADQFDPIPEDLKTYCGDDYLFHKVRGLGYKIVKMSNNFIYHYGNSTIIKVWPDKITTRLKEKEIWKNIQG